MGSPDRGQEERDKFGQVLGELQARFGNNPRKLAVEAAKTAGYMRGLDLERRPGEANSTDIPTAATLLYEHSRRLALREGLVTDIEQVRNGAIPNGRSTAGNSQYDGRGTEASIHVPSGGEIYPASLHGNGTEVFPHPPVQAYPNLPPRFQVDQTMDPEIDPHPQEYYVGNRGTTPPLPEIYHTNPSFGDIRPPDYHTGGPGPYMPPRFRTGGR